MNTEVAPVTSHRSVDESPAFMGDGLTVKEFTTGTADAGVTASLGFTSMEGLTVSIAVAVAEPPAFEAIKT